MANSYDVVVIGAGPTGMACAIEVQRLGMSAVLIEKGCLVNSIFRYPANMVFFTTPDRLVIGNIPFTTSREKPTRLEALEYYRNVATHYGLLVKQYERVESVKGNDGNFQIESKDRFGAQQVYLARKVVVATGYYDLPNVMNIPGENLPKVMHYYGEPHPYYDTDVLVIGGKNSAAIAALELWRRGARVILAYRGATISRSVKYWIKPDIENRIKAGEITGYFNTLVREIALDSVTLETPGGVFTIKNDFVFALTGYHPDFDFLRDIGIALEADALRPICDPQTLESNVAGMYVAGVIVGGSRTSEIFIENGRFHGFHIAADIKQKLDPR